MGSQELKYDAFISYRHSELDKFVAETLHKELEGFRLPSNLLKKMGNQGDRKTKINRVFRDRDELPIASNLADPIVKALESTDFLIVICTPRLPESIWCKTEIETFIKLHGREKVLAVLAEGEPHESFPQAILYDENKNPVEPLAADVRGNTKKDIRKKIKEEVIRLAAPMFECAYDELKQRHRERKLKRIIMASAIGTAVCLVFGLVSTTMALRIRTQSMEIKKQAEKIEEQYTEAMKTNAKSLAADSLRLLEEGDRINAIQTALSALPDNTNQNDMPYTPQAQYALTESLYVYENGYQILPTHILEQDAEISFVKLSPQKDRILIADIYGKVSVWDVAKTKKIAVIYENSANIGITEGQVAFLTNDLVVFSKDRGFAVYDIFKNVEVYENKECALYKVVSNKNETHFGIFNYNGVYVFETNTVTEIFRYENETGERILFASDIDTQGNRVAFATEKKDKEGTTQIQIKIYDVLTKQLKQVKQLSCYTLQQLLLFENQLYIVVYQEKTGTTAIFPEYRGTIYSYDIEQSKMRWEFVNEKGSINEVKKMEIKKEEFLLFSGYDHLVILDYQTGEKIDECVYGQEIVSFEPYINSAIIEIGMRDGEYHFWNIETKLDIVPDEKFKISSNNIKYLLKGDKYFASLEYGDTKIIIYNLICGEAVKEFYSGSGYVSDIKISENEKKSLLVQNNEITILNMEKDKIINNLKFEEMIIAADFEKGDKNIILLLPSKIVFINAESGLVQKQIDVEEKLYDFITFISEKNEVATYQTKQIQIIDVKTGKLKDTLVGEDEFDILDVYAIGSVSDKYAIASKSSTELKIYNRSTKKCIAKIPIKTSCVSYINFANEDTKLYITYIDGKVEVYNLKTFELEKKYTEFEEEVKKVYTSEKDNSTYLFTTKDGYILDENGEIIARIDSLKGVMPKNNKIVISNINNLFTVPIYNASDLINEAKKQLSK